MKKVIKDGMVAFLYSPEYGAGWSTWNRSTPQCLFEPAIVEIVLEMDNIKSRVRNLPLKERRVILDEELRPLVSKIETLAKELYGDNFYAGGGCSLTVKWLKEGTLFKVDEYDGFESIETKENDDWLVA